MCRAKFLNHMVDAGPNFEKMVLDLVSRGVRGVLLSGGFRKDFTLPVEKIVDDLERIRPLLKFVSAHLGMHRSPSLLSRLSRAVNVVDFEFVATRRDAANLRGLEPRLYLETLETMVSLGLEVVPHVFLWTPWRELSDVLEELSIVESMGLRRATLLVLMGFGDPPQKIVEWLSRAATHFGGELYLGCMRPWSCRSWLDVFAAREGLVDRIAVPHPRALEFCEAVYDCCCSVPHDLASYFEVKLILGGERS